MIPVEILEITLTTSGMFDKLNDQQKKQLLGELEKKRESTPIHIRKYKQHVTQYIILRLRLDNFRPRISFSEGPLGHSRT